MNTIAFLLIVLLQILVTIPDFLDQCNNLNIEAFAMYFSHHFLDVFLFWSPLFLQKKSEFILHILLVIIVTIHWLTYNNRCILTVYMNRVCGIDEDQWLDSLKNRFGLVNYSEYFHFHWIALVLLYDVVRLYFM